MVIVSSSTTIGGNAHAYSASRVSVFGALKGVENIQSIDGFASSGNGVFFLCRKLVAPSSVAALIVLAVIDVAIDVLWPIALSRHRSLVQGLGTDSINHSMK